jgi:hypothetical protein
VTNEYWINIEEICKQRDLKVVHLEDFPTYMKYAQKLGEKYNLDNELLKRNIEFRKHNPYSGTKIFEEIPEIIKLLRNIYQKQTEADYIFTIEREQKIFDKIAEAQPQVVILGKGHADYVMLKPKEFSSRKIPMGEYRTEERHAPRRFGEEIGNSDEAIYMLRNPNPDKKELLDRELLKRRYSAITESRILPDKIPDYIGTWDLNIPARGLFEIYLNPKNKFVGKIEDALGTASFMGEIKEEGLFFTKNYDMGKSSSSAMRDTIAYNANCINRVYIGTFNSPSAFSNDKEYPFAIRKFSKTEKLKLF